jgi:hypothetical protein
MRDPLNGDNPNAEPGPADPDLKKVATGPNRIHC